MDGGPNGGLQSCTVDVLWHIHHGEETSNISDDVLRLLEILTMAKQDSKGDELYHIVNTDRVEWFTKGKVGLTKVQCGVRMKRPYNFHEVTKKGARCAVQDIDTLKCAARVQPAAGTTCKAIKSQRECVCCLLVLNSVTSTSQWIRRSDTQDVPSEIVTCSADERR
jgi:hypothetical protein